MMLRRRRSTDPHLESRVRDQAYFLMRDHGDEAAAIIARKLARPDLDPHDAHRYKLIAARIAQAGREGQAPGAPRADKAGRGRKRSIFASVARLLGRPSRHV